MPYLALVRHGKSEWNALGKWTGWTDVELAPEGHEEARRAGEALADIDFHHVHVSGLTRAQQTAWGILAALERELELEIHEAMNERHYGIHTGKNKWEVKEEIGEEAFQNIRRGWDAPIPEGETLKDVHARVVPYFEEHVRVRLSEGKNVLIVAHGNSLRALVKHLEDIADENIHEVEIGTGEVHVYELHTDGTVLGKEVRSVNENKKTV